MPLRYLADLRSLAYGGVCVLLFVLNWRHGGFHPLLYPLLLFFSFSTAIMAHNHNHAGVFKKRWMNVVWTHFLSFFYGHPVTVWVPVHNRNHHGFVNAPGDWSVTYRATAKNNFFAVMSYNTLSSIAELKGAMRYFWSLRKKQRTEFILVAFEYALWGAIMLSFLIWDWKKSLFYLVIPGQITVFTIHVFNYMQHVDTDFESRWDHSRNFTSPIMNTILFNNGYHTMHHEKAGLHWSLLKKAHGKIAKNIDKRLLQWDPLIYLIQTCFFGFGPTPIRDLASVRRRWLKSAAAA